MTEPEHPGGILLVIEEVADRDAAVRFAIEWGGENFHVPTPARLMPGHPLRSLEWRHAVQVACRSSGENVYVSRAREWVAWNLYSGGATVKQVAHILDISIRSARRFHRLFSGNIVP